MKIKAIVALLAIAMLEVPIAHALTFNWPQFGGDSQGTRNTRHLGPTRKPGLRWFFPTNTQVSSPLDPLVYAGPTIGLDGTIYSPSYDGNIYAINPDGTKAWSYEVGDILRSSVTVSGDGTLYQLSSRGLLHLNSTGGLISNNPLLRNNDPSVTLTDGGRILVGSSGELSLREANGSEVWSIGMGGIEGTPVVGSEGAIYVPSQSESAVNAVDGQGQLLWRFHIPGRNVRSATVGADGTIYAGGQGGDFFAINPDGTEKWAFGDSDDIYTAAALGADSVVFAALDGIYALDLEGNELWHYSESSGGHGSVITDGRGNVFATRNNRVIGLTSEGDLMWEYELDDSNFIYSSVALDRNGVLYFGASDGLYAIAIPEPTTLTLAGLGLVAAVWWRRRI